MMVEPRLIDYVIPIMNEYYKFLGDTWNYVFYCGKGTLSAWKSVIEHFKASIDFRELDVENFWKPCEYSDFMKQKSLWESLEGEFILTVQLDTWPMNLIPIDTFLALNQSYIGGNMCGIWDEMIRESVDKKINLCNCNGGLSLRKRLDMIKVIDAFPPKPTFYMSGFSPSIELDPEDVYFYLGCYKLGLPVGDDEVSFSFVIHEVYKDKYFAIHNPTHYVIYVLSQKNPELKNLNPYLKMHAVYSPDI